MRSGSSKAVRLLCVCMAAFMLCSCGAPQIETAELVPSEATPKPESEREAPKYEAVLYFPTSDGRKLLPESRQIIMDGKMNYTEAALRALCVGASTQSQLAVLQNGVEFDRVEVSTGICNVYFKGMVELDERQWLITRAAVAATVNAAAGSSYVNLYYNEIEPGYMGRPLGAISPILESLDVYIKNMELEYEALQKEREEASEDISYEMRNATVYMIDAQTHLLLSQNMIISYSARASETDIARTLIETMRLNAAEENMDVGTALPSGLKLSEVPAFIRDEDEASLNASAAEKTAENKIRENAPGIIELSIFEPSAEYDEELLCGAITLTLTGYIPNVYGVRILAQDADGEKRNLSGVDLFTRDMFSNLIGYSITIDYPNEDGNGLNQADRAVSNSGSDALTDRLSALLSDSDGTNAMLSVFSPDDVQRVYISGDTAVIDWKAGFTSKLRALETDESLTVPKDKRIWIYIYSVINTMTEFPGIQRVWMLENGRKMGAIGDIYLGNALMRNPGIMLDSSDE